MAAAQPADRDTHRQCRDGLKAGRPSEIDTRAAGAGNGEDPLRLAVKIQQRPAFERGYVETLRAEHSGFLICRENRFQPGAGERGIVQQRKDHGDGSAVVTAQRCAACTDQIAVDKQLQTFARHVFLTARRRSADHVKMPLYDDGRGVFITRCSGRDDDDVVQRILIVLQSSRLRKADTVITDSFCVAAAVRDGAERFKVMKNRAGFQLIKNHRRWAPSSYFDYESCIT